MTVSPIEIEALFAAGCDSRDATMAMIDEIAARFGVPFTLDVVTVNSVGEARAARFLGSPSVRINGVDIEPDSETRDDYGVG